MAPLKEIKFETYKKATELTKSRFTKIQDTVSKITCANIPLSTVQVRQLNTFMAEVRKKRDDFELNVQRVLDLAEASETILSTDMDVINDLFVDITSMIEASIAPVAVSPLSTTTESVHFPTASVAVKLPKLDLQTFDGQPLKWTSFINLFDTAVHKNASISNVSKFQYLLSVLSGEPLNLIKSLNLTAANYLVAYNLLKDRFHNTRRLITLHLNHILDLAPIARNNPKQLRNFITTFYEHTESLKALECNITEDNPLLSAHLLRKLDAHLIQKLEQFRISHDEHAQPHSLPSVSEIIKFLNNECSQIEDASLHSPAVEKPRPSTTTSFKPRSDLQKRGHSSSKDVALLTTSNSTQSPGSKANSCFCCLRPGHKIYTCPVFKNKSPHERYQMVKNNSRCISCLGTHNSKDCRSTYTCASCHKKHHSLLHFESNGPTSRTPVSALPPNTSHSRDHAQPRTHAPPQANASTSPPPPTEAALTCSQPKTANQHSTVVLGTALVNLIATNGKSFVFRALLDSGSMTCFISERAAQLLGTKRLPSNITVTGLTNKLSHTKGLMTLDVQSLSGYSIATQHSFHILDKIAIDLPRVELAPEVFAQARHYTLADPTFDKPGPIDILLGGSLYPQVLTNECHSLGQNMPFALGTLFGYAIVGNAPCYPLSSSNITISLLSTADNDLHTSLQRFWTQEELPPCNTKIEEEIQCDKLFDTTHSRDPSGRYVVRLPFRTDSPQIGQSKYNAEQRFHSLERKLHSQNNSEFRTLYRDFMQEYDTLGHMEKCCDLDLNSPHYFLPHHGVLKAQSSTTKLRVVFDASAKTTSGLSLNDVLLTGPKLQNNICDILLYFRLPNVVFTCDIRQMYRQIQIHPDDQPYQLILWRDDPSKPLSTYKLTTVTYGINCSPYLAIKTLKQLAEDEGSHYPLAAKILNHHSYVDDLIAGADSEEHALELQNQLISLLRLGGFELRKWVSNCPRLLHNLPAAHQESPVFMQPSAEPHFSILGLHWSPVSDCFKYNFDFTCEHPTKRKVLSLIAQVYDPCGFLSPCTMIAKRFMQLLWTSGNTWDEPLTPEMSLKWHNFVSDLKHIVDIAIPRAIQLPQGTQCDIHGFSDASESGYAAVVYLRCISDCEVRVSQLIAKTRVAPLKRVTLPRLELCAAHLLAQLARYCVTQLEHELKIDSITLWCDSTVTLSWLKTPPYRLKTYVANRVAQTQELFAAHCWRHVPSADNPADCASRGIMPAQLVQQSLWWHGPSWLQLAPSNWPLSDFAPLDIASMEEVKPTPLTVFVAAPEPRWDLLTHFSSWTKLLHVTAYVLRFVTHSRRSERQVGPLSVAEMKAAQLRIFKIVQQEYFANDILAIRNNGLCSSRLQRLAPFLDQDGLLRVGGRLRHSGLHEDIRHPVILPKKHPVVNLFIDYIHVRHLHAGAQLTMSLLAQHVWVLSARSVVRSRIFQCLTCFKHKPRNTLPLMGDLPKPRVTPARPFMSTGIDYGGPFTIKVHNLRSIRHVKAYMCLFVCLVTKAVHIEIATDLSTDSFIAALTRFVSRRGLCTDIYSDCATNFVGARNALHDVILSADRQHIQNFALDRNIKFHFNPPSAPHQGGLWESAIKSAKHHMKRVLGTHVPTLMELSTLTCQVEAMLNSRPLTALSSDPNDLQALTPGHFLIGAPLAAVPEHNLVNIPDNRLSQWQLSRAFAQRIWNRWSKEYLHTLQSRLKWSKPTRNLEVGDLVLVQQDTPSLTWPLARVIKVAPGHDNTVRVVELKTPYGTLKRPAVKVFLLPFLSS